MSMKEKIIHVRVPSDLHSAFKRAADYRGLPMSILIRELMTAYCRDNQQLDLLDFLAISKAKKGSK